MWLVVRRSPLPDAPYWRGRCWLAAVDAVAWPLVWMLILHRAGSAAGIMGPVLIALAVMIAISRLRRALWSNHRYRFTTWRWTRTVLALLVAAAVVRLAMAA